MRVTCFLPLFAQSCARYIVTAKSTSHKNYHTISVIGTCFDKRQI